VNYRRKDPPNANAAIARLGELYAAQGAQTHGGDRRSVAFKEASARGERLKSATAHLALVTGKSQPTIRRKRRIEREGSARVKRALVTKAITETEAEAQIEDETRTARPASPFPATRSRVGRWRGRRGHCRLML
jgi:hypothetical protein